MWCFMLLNWSNIDTVLLDMDGTLLDLRFDNYFWTTHLPLRYSELFESDLSIAKQSLRRRLEEKRGTLDWYSTEFWARELCLDIVALKREVKYLIRERPNVSKFLVDLGNIGKERILVTNADHNSIEIKFAETTIYQKLDKIVSSHDLGYPKEHHKFWSGLQKTFVFDPLKTLFIDDSEAMLLAAKEFGVANLLTIARPDSSGSLYQTSGFVALHDFDELNVSNCLK